MSCFKLHITQIRLFGKGYTKKWVCIFRGYDKKFQKSTINICLVVCICSPGVYWAPSRELHEGAPFLGNGILAPYIFRSYDKKFQKSTIIICLVVWICNTCSPGIYWAPSRELQEGAPFLEYWIWAPSTSRSSQKKFQSFTIKIGSAVCILVLVFVWY